MPQEKQVREIVIRTDVKGGSDLAKISKSLGGLNRNVQSLSGSMSILRTGFLSYFASLSVGQLTQMSDGIQQLKDRINVLAGSTEAGAKAFQGLQDVAVRTKSSVEGVATIYARFAAATKNAVVNSDELLKITEALQNSFRLSGATAAEAAGASVQLAQGLGSGALRGQELRSVLEQNVVLADLLAKEFADGNKGLLFKLAEKNLIGSNRTIQLLLDSTGKLRSEADKLGQTFGQTVTIALDKVAVKLEEVNRKFDITGKFASGVNTLLSNMTAILAGTLAAAVAGIVAKLSILASGGGILTGIVAILGGPVLASALAFGAAVGVIASYWDDIASSIGDAEKSQKRIRAQRPAFADINVDADKFKGLGTLFKDLENSLPKNGVNIVKSLNDSLGLNKFRFDEEGLIALRKKERLEQDELARQKLLNTKRKKSRDYLAEINLQFLNDRDANKYFKALGSFELEKLSRELKEGKKNLYEFEEARLDLKVVSLTRDINSGALSLEQFNAAIEANGIQQLNLQFEQGAITLREYESELVKISTTVGPGGIIRAGTTDFINSIGTTGSLIADVVKNSFKGMEDAIFEATKSGKLNFEDLTQSILDDLTRIAIRSQILGPLAGAIGGIFAPASPAPAISSSTGLLGANTTFNAKGAAYDNGIRKFAKGGLVNSPTLFNYGSGKTGLMGEAGTEAILPLSRGSNGNLGVQASLSPVTINISNTNGSDIQTTEKSGPNGERTIELIVQNKVREGIARGTFDKSFQQAYGFKRKGG